MSLWPRLWPQIIHAVGIQGSRAEIQLEPTTFPPGVPTESYGQMITALKRLALTQAVRLAVPVIAAVAVASDDAEEEERG